SMPQLDGFQTASIIKSRPQSRMIPIIFVTSSASAIDHVYRGYTVGAVDYLHRPVDPCAVRSKVSVFVELFRQRKQLETQAAQLHEVELREQHRLRERAEHALLESESLYQLTFDEAPVAIGHANPEGQWLTVNRRFAEILGRDAASLYGRRIEAIGAADEDVAALAQRLLRVRNGAPVSNAEHRLTAAGRPPVWAEVTLSALRSGTGELRRIIAVVEDITDRKEIELDRARVLRELEDGIRARDDFLSIAAHELRTPMTPLRIAASSLLEELAEPREVSTAQVMDRVAMIDRAARRVEDLIDRLLSEAVINAGELALRPEEVDLVAVVTEAIGRVRDDARRAATPIVLAAPGPVRGRWDPFWTRQAITHLLVNAIRFGAHRPIDVEVAADRDRARIAVTDHGIGIPEDAQRRIFDRFERIAPVRHFGGFGIGLWIVRRVIEAQGGRVEVASRAGEGSRFSIELPRATRELGAASPHLPPTAQTRSVHG
ncbi:MAG: hybrid sensor histidine kinase/response regulator, partial [Kofleriaceae bacterium]